LGRFERVARIPTVLPAIRGIVHAGVVAYNFLTADPDQSFLLPPDVREWLPPDHLAWFVIDVVAAFEAGPFVGRHRRDGRGGAAYDPMVMVAVLVYAYCVGERSSRRIERRLIQDVAFRVVARNLAPDHATIARFRAAHEQALAGLFVEVLGLCTAAGLVEAGLVAIDGTKIKACAAMSANRDEEGLAKALEAEAKRFLAEAAAVDAEEDALFGDARGDELPAEFADPKTRAGRIKEALDRLRAEREAGAAKEAAAAAEREAKGQQKRGPKPNPDRAQRPKHANMTDPDSRVMKTHGGFVQGYNAQAAVNEAQVIVAAEVTQDAGDAHQLVPMLDATAANLAAVDASAAVTAVVADAGYYSTDNITLDPGYELLIATSKVDKLPTEAPPAPVDPRADVNRQADARAAELAALLERVAANELTTAAVAASLGVTPVYVNVLHRRYRAGGVNALRPRRSKRGTGRRLPPPTPPGLAARVAMQARLASPEGRRRYRRRSVIVEPVFGQIKDARGIRGFQRRGLNACAAEWKLIAATHNLLKLWRVPQPA
jgi:transposase